MPQPAQIPQPVEPQTEQIPATDQPQTEPTSIQDLEISGIDPHPYKRIKSHGMEIDAYNIDLLS